MRLSVVVLVLILAIAVADGAEIYGKIYRWDTLDVMKDVIVEIKDGTVQRIVSEDGSYSFNVSPGNYTIIAWSGEYMAVENLTVKNTTRFDLILFPKLGEIEEVPEFPAINVESEPPYYLLAAAASAFIVVALYLIKRRSGREAEQTDVPSGVLSAEHADDLPEDLAEVVEIIKREGGRITQKELRKRLGYSEAKMSLIIADLERRGVVEKVKKGRGNIIFLK
ncbi:helix-turn-helix transcriptional regulator [Archaeoglobus neptunius]|uniref:helix-turn-helix transcriptional regulator n=1 Tax=Archaeoglobus neptunius TaxID=2798580 RepID=UPI0019260CAC|nr:MarR family transcriptional regulator [Archaeoglobus neptunius]